MWSTLDDIALRIDTLSGYVRASFVSRVGSSWKWTDDQANTDIPFADHDYGALITMLFLGSAGALKLVGRRTRSGSPMVTRTSARRPSTMS